MIIGRVLCPELSIVGATESPTWGVTRNPWDTDRTPGGSSGGSAAAVAAGLAAGATASDGAGSIRLPAANCGLFGLKPQRGRVRPRPDPEHWYGMSVYGCVTRTVLDTAVYLDAVAGAIPGDAALVAAAGAPLRRVGADAAGQAADRRSPSSRSSRRGSIPAVRGLIEETAERAARPRPRGGRARARVRATSAPAMLPRYLKGDPSRTPGRWLGPSACSGARAASRASAGASREARCWALRDEARHRAPRGGCSTTTTCCSRPDGPAAGAQRSGRAAVRSRRCSEWRCLSLHRRLERDGPAGRVGPRGSHAPMGCRRGVAGRPAGRRGHAPVARRPARGRAAVGRTAAPAVA